jgi:hypothetical protein
VGVCYDADAQCRAAHRVGQGFTWAKAENRVSAAAAAASAAAAGYQAAAAGLVAAAARGPMVASVGVLHTFRHQVSGVRRAGAEGSVVEDSSLQSRLVLFARHRTRSTKSTL